MKDAHVKRYEQYPDKASYHRSPGMVDFIRTLYFKRRYRIKIGDKSKICRHVEIKRTKNAVLEIGHHTTIADYTFLQLTMPTPHVTIGNNTVIGRNCIIASKTNLTIGNYVLIGAYCQLIDHSHNVSPGDLIMNQQATCTSLHINDDVWLGTGVKVLHGVTIGTGAVVGANSVVTRSIPEYEIWAGNPAKFINKRS